MQLWGITLDASAAIFLSVAAGLAVDYSAHIAHAFITMTGKSKDERVQKTIIEMGSAVFNGGFSTFLAFSVLMVSRSFLFNVFFKIFFLVVLFGLFHGLVFLPVVLSLIGPPTIAASHVGNNAIKPEEKVTEVETVESIAESVSTTSKEVNGKQ
jgi:predicted RND superfamily exporter protein